MADLPASLAEALAREAGRVAEHRLAATTRRLIDRYQADVPATPGQPIMDDDTAARAYAAYRMPATFAAARAVLDQLPDLPLTSQLDVAGGTGALLWAAAERWPSLERQVVLEQAPAAVALGRALAAGSELPVVRTADWRPTVLTGGDELPAADLVTVGYLLSEIDAALQARLVGAAAEAARRLLIIVEPGTKNGYRRILAARDQLIGAGLQVVAPCPHQLACPLKDDDWCHFAARVNRSGVHRRAKGGELGYEDEKFSYLVVSREALPRGDNRVLRHPRFAKGRVQLELCRSDGRAAPQVVSKRDGDAYKLARKVSWGDPWPDRWPDGWPDRTGQA